VGGPQWPSPWRRGRPVAWRECCWRRLSRGGPLCSTPWHAMHTLARHAAPCLRHAPQLAGAVIAVDLHTNTVWVLGQARAAVQPETQAAAQLARRHGTFALWFRGSATAGQDATCVAWGHATAAPMVGKGRLLPGPVRQPAGQRSLVDAMTVAWGAEQAAAAVLWAHEPSDTLLPPLRQEFKRYRAIVDEVSKEEERAGQAGARSEKSLDSRAAAMLLAVDLQRQLADPNATALPASLYRRLVGKALTAMLHPSTAAPKPHWFDLEGIVEKAGWERLTADNCGYPWPHTMAPKDAAQECIDRAGCWKGMCPCAACAAKSGGGAPAAAPPAKLQFLNPNALLLAYKEAAGGELAHDHVVWTVCAHLAGHTPQVAPHLQAAIDSAMSQGTPLWLFDKERMEPLPHPREREAWWAQVVRLVQQGSWRELTTHVGGDIYDASQCLMIGEMG